MTIADYIMPLVVLLTAIFGWILSWIFFLRGKISDLRSEMIEKHDLATFKNDLVREIGTLRESTLTDIAELRADVREIRQDVKDLLAR